MKPRENAVMIPTGRFDKLNDLIKKKKEREALQESNKRRLIGAK